MTIFKMYKKCIKMYKMYKNDKCAQMYHIRN